MSTLVTDPRIAAVAVGAEGSGTDYVILEPRRTSPFRRPPSPNTLVDSRLKPPVRTTDGRLVSACDSDP